MRNRQINLVAKATLILIAALVLSGCAVGPNYHRPTVQTPPAFHGPDQSQQTEPQTTSFADLPWWQVFHDPQLQDLIRTALKQNYDLQLAVERVNAARAQVGIVRSNEFPMVSLNPTFSGGKTDQNIKSNIFSLAGDVVFQVDLFGRYRRATEAARAQLLGTQDAQQTVVLTLVSDVASDYFLLRDLDLQLQITRETVRTQEDSVKLTKLRLQHGVATTLDVLQARQVLDVANTQIPDLERQIGQTEDALNILLGKYPDNVPRGMPLGIETPEGLDVERVFATSVAHRPSFAVARTQARHPSSRGEPGSRECQHWRCQSNVFPADLASRLWRSGIWA